MSRRPLAPLNAGSIQDQERQDTVDFRAAIRENYGVVFFNNGIWVMPPPPVPDDDDEDIEEEEEEDEEFSDSDGDADDELEDSDDSDEDVEYVFDSDPEEPAEEQREQ